MLLKDLMEEKQLNLSQPLLSVRRYSSTKSSKRSKRYSYSSTRFPSPPSYRSDLKSGPVRTAGAVPFVWEKAPGKPKELSNSKKDAIITLNPSTGKVSKVNQQQYFDAASACGSNKVSDSVRISDKEEVKEKEKVAGSDDSDDDENFVDALDTLSRTESFFMSTASVVEDQEVLQPSRSLASLPSNRDFIIDRFLPAAKALTSGPQPPSFRKKIVGQEQQQQREVKKVVRPENSLPLTLSQHRPKALPHYVEDKTGDCDGAENFTATGCGLFPKLCLLSPITGSRNDDETTKEHAKTSFPWKKSSDSQPGFTEIKDILCVSEKSKHHSRGCSNKPSSSCEIPVVEKTLYVDSMPKVKSHSSSISPQVKNQKLPIEVVALKNQQVGTKVGEDGKIDLESQRVMQLVSHKETNHDDDDDDTSYMQLSLELPSLKAPSESWLKRTLPTISTSNLQSRTNNTCGRSQAHKTDSSMYPKWETIVKSSNVHHGHQRLPKELLASIPEA
ncbi:hypothetical protein PIB30_032681 [Stylosanthes scabra]|uniref:Uncharacterized protein n=1 Tax=Stylosanthes scabra TaxID=79078 RepID=A0ABU6ZBP8_9FABA|nr:hypothetical protein [Stylosanthes scabra]